MRICRLCGLKFEKPEHEYNCAVSMALKLDGQVRRLERRFSALSKVAKGELEGISVNWSEEELLELAKETGMTISDRDFKIVLWSYDHAEKIEKEVKEAGKKILLDIFGNRWSLKEE